MLEAHAKGLVKVGRTLCQTIFYEECAKRTFLAPVVCEIDSVDMLKWPIANIIFYALEKLRCGD